MFCFSMHAKRITPQPQLETVLKSLLILSWQYMSEPRPSQLPSKYIPYKKTMKRRSNLKLKVKVIQA